MYQTLDKAKVIGLIQLEHAFTLRTIRGLTQEQIRRPGLVGTWSAKDIIAHLSSWHRRFMGWIEDWRAGRTPVRPEAGYTWETLNLLNDACRERDRALPLKQVLEDFDLTVQPIIALVQELTEAQLTEDGQFPWLPCPMCETVANNTYLHYLEHITKLRAAVSP